MTRKPTLGPSEGGAGQHASRFAQKAGTPPRENLQAALAHYRGGRYNEAQAMCDQVLGAAPENVDALNLLGVIAGQTGNYGAAVDAFARAIKLQPESADLHRNLGLLYRSNGRLEDAAEALGKALSLKPDLVEACDSLGTVRREQGNVEEAIALHQKALSLDPEFAAAHRNLGRDYQQQGKLAVAERHFCKALRLDPNDARTYVGLGLLARRQEKIAEAETAYERALELDPRLAEAHYNLGNIHHQENRLERATTHYQRALSINPDYAEAHLNLGLTWLLAGELEQGWREYEWRLRLADAAGQRPELDVPRWTGAPLKGKRVLLYTEQGFGDAIQFARYAPLVKARGGTVIVECQSVLARLLGTVPGVDQVMARGGSVPRVDAQAPLMSLPAILGTTLETVPRDVPYVAAPPGHEGRFDRSLARAEGRRKIGIVWAGNPAHKNDRHRSCPLRHFLALSELPDVALFSLQKEPPEHDPLCGPQVVDLTSLLDDFADTAAAIERLDLVISVDTAVAHLAGALGRPVWLVLPFAPDWRWLLDREDSPWYPSMRLFRQQRSGDWEGVFQRLAKVLAETD